jgi:hypothetical protein
MKIPRMTLPAHLLRWPIAFLTALLVVGGVVTPTPRRLQLPRLPQILTSTVHPAPCRRGRPEN